MIVRNSRGQEMIIDEEDLHLLNPDRRNPGCYNFRFDYKGYCIVSNLKFHHIVIGKPPDGFETDHVNRVKNDNRKFNLRHVTRSANQLNKNKYKNSTSKYRGIYFCKKCEKFKAQITIKGKSKHIGFFSNELEAAQAYDRYVIENNLPQQLNFPHEMSVAKS
jgi:hypothetical protein